MFCKNKEMFIKKFKGFLIAEVLIASFLLTVGLVASMDVIRSSLRYSLDSQDTIIAAMLAQEGVELVRNVRDNDFLVAGHDGFTGFGPSNKHCRIDYNISTANLDCNSSQGSASRYTLTYSGGFYQHQASSQERFSRYVYINYDSGAGKATVLSFVYWGGGTSGMFLASDTGSTGDTTKCTIANKCVFTEIILTAWK